MRTKLYLLPILLWANICAAQAVLTGYVVEGKNATPLRGALITIVKAKQSSQSGADGSFSFTSPPQQGEIKVSLQGYASQVLPYQLPLKNPVTIILHEKVQEIEEVTLSTGYQKVAKERATGSFSVVSKAGSISQWDYGVKWDIRRRCTIDGKRAQHHPRAKITTHRIG